MDTDERLMAVDARLDGHQLGGNVVGRGGDRPAIGVGREKDAKVFIRLRGLCFHFELSREHQDDGSRASRFRAADVERVGLAASERFGDMRSDARQELRIGVGEGSCRIDAPELEESPATKRVAEND